jgi:hypothetical protein
VVGVLVAVGLAFSNQVPIQFLLVVKDGVGKSRGCKLKSCIEAAEVSSICQGRI